MEPVIRSVGEGAVLALFGNSISPETQRRIQTAQDYTERHPFPGFMECVTSYTGLTVYYDPWKVKCAFPDKRAFETVRTFMDRYIKESEEKEAPAPRHVEIPVCYGGRCGPDLAYVASFHHMTEEEVVRIHTGAEYLVYMIGFCPGFPYMGGMDPRIATPRRKSPRLVIPAGSIGIAGEQTGGYPIATPGGWQLIGRTPLDMFRPADAAEPTLLRSGDRVRFKAVTEDEYREIRGARP